MMGSDHESMHSQDCTDIQMRIEARETPCDLCHRIGGTNSVFNSIPKSVNENIDQVHIDEMCNQIAKTFRKKVQIERSVTPIEDHITHHKYYIYSRSHHMPHARLQSL